MTVGLAIAVLALIATVVLLTMSDKGGGPEDPANVKVGAEQRDYGDDPAPTATASKATPTKVRPPPRRLPPKPPSVKKPKEPEEDIYDDL